jgi:hypothetical protein
MIDFFFVSKKTVTCLHKVCVGDFHPNKFDLDYKQVCLTANLSQISLLLTIILLLRYMYTHYIFRN